MWNIRIIHEGSGEPNAHFHRPQPEQTLTQQKLPRNIKAHKKKYTDSEISKRYPDALYLVLIPFITPCLPPLLYINGRYTPKGQNNRRFEILQSNLSVGVTKGKLHSAIWQALKIIIIKVRKSWRYSKQWREWRAPVLWQCNRLPVLRQ